MSITPMKAIVLLGYRNAGKDSIFNELAKAYDVQNAKFACLGKDTVAQLCQVPLQWLEDKEWREEEYINGISPRQMLDALFYLVKEDASYCKQVHEYLFNSLITDYLPVFTDIRRREELDAVIKKYGLVLVCWVTRENLEIGAADVNLANMSIELEDDGKIDLHLSGTLEQNVAEIVGYLTYTIKRYVRKPTLYLLNDFRKASVASSLNSYEPLGVLVDKAQQLLRDTGSRLALNALVSALYNETDSEDLPLTPITQDCYMVYMPKQHERMLPGLRKLANIRLLSPDTFDKTMFLEGEYIG